MRLARAFTAGLAVGYVLARRRAAAARPPVAPLADPAGTTRNKVQAAVGLAREWAADGIERALGASGRN